MTKYKTKTIKLTFPTLKEEKRIKRKYGKIQTKKSQL